MEVRATTARDVTLLTVAVVLGVLLSPAFPYVGLPIAAVGIASLSYRGSALAAAIACAVGVVGVALVSWPDLAFVVPAVVAILLAVVLLPRWDTQAVGALLIGVITLAGIGGAALYAASQHTTLTASIAQSAKEASAAVTAALGSSATTGTTEWLATATKLVSAAWPWTYFEVAVLTAVLVIAVVTWAARRVGRELPVPALAQLDLTPHVLWAFVAGLLLLAASYAQSPATNVLWVLGLNLVLCARTLFFLQGFSVSAGVLDRAGVGLGVRILALAALAVVDAFTLVLSFVGLLDFWVNFRKLPREGSEAEPPAFVGE